MFITFEGIEGSGKSTQCRRLKTRLEQVGRHSVLLTREPGASTLGRHLRSILLDPAQPAFCSRAELFLYLADRAQHVKEVIEPALENGRVVIADRFSHSTLAYQGYGRGLDLEILHQVNDFAVQGLRPDCTVLIDLPAEIGLARAMARNQESPQSAAESRFEAEALDFHRRVRRGFLELAARTPERFCTLDGAQAPDQVFQELWTKLGAALPGLSGLNPPAPPEAAS